MYPFTHRNIYQRRDLCVNNFVCKFYLNFSGFYSLACPLFICHERHRLTKPLVLVLLILRRRYKLIENAHFELKHSVPDFVLQLFLANMDKMGSLCLKLGKTV